MWEGVSKSQPTCGEVNNHAVLIKLFPLGMPLTVEEWWAASWQKSVCLVLAQRAEDICSGTASFPKCPAKAFLPKSTQTKDTVLERNLFPSQSNCWPFHWISALCDCGGEAVVKDLHGEVAFNFPSHLYLHLWSSSRVKSIRLSENQIELYVALKIKIVALLLLKSGWKMKFKSVVKMSLPTTLPKV